MRTYGSVIYDKSGWIIECEPHVMLRLKRVFSRLAKTSHGRARIQDSPDISRDLEWFMQRYPMRISEMDAGRMSASSSIYEERAEASARILNDDYDAPDLPLALPLRDYQARATQLYLIRKRLLVGDDVGLGKTAVGIGSLCDPRTLPAVVVTLTALPRQWQRECAKFLPGLHTHVVTKSTAYDLPEWFGHKPDVVIMNYSKLGLGNWATALEKYARSIIFDECQELRRRDSNKWRACKHLADSCAFRMGLSATPIYNYGGELWNIYEVLAPDYLGTAAEFEREWCSGFSVSGNQAVVKEPKALGSYLRDAGIFIRRTRSDVGRELPEISKIIHEIDADPRVLQKIRTDATELARIILSDAQDGQKRRYMASGQFDMLMRQATGISKAPYVAEFVRMLLESEEKILVYAWHREVYTLLLDALREARPVMFTGSENAKEKEKSFEAFTKGQSRVMLMSLRSGAGVDGLQHSCRTVVYGELDWSPGVHEQATGRVARDGQTDPVMSYYLVSDNDESTDPFVMQALGLKKAQVDGIRDPEGNNFEVLQSKKLIRELAQKYLERNGGGTPKRKRASGETPGMLV